MLKRAISSRFPAIFEFLVDNIRQISPYSSFTRFSLPFSVSDLFYWDTSYAKITFTAENFFSLYQSALVPSNHLLTFLSSSGEVLYVHSQPSKDFFDIITIPLDALPDNCFGSFLHTIQPDDENCLNVFGSNKSKSNACLQSRGYTTYFKNRATNVGSIVHGNFGGITPELNSIAVSRKLHHYTSPYLFQHGNSYQLIFSNPLLQSLLISLISASSEVIYEGTIDPLGTCSITIESYFGFITVISCLPVCRPLIVKNPPPSDSLDFDVLHS